MPIPGEAGFHVEWRDARGSDRIALIQARKQAFVTLQASARNEIARLGGSVIGSFWSSNALDVTISAAKLQRLRAHADVIGIWPADVGGVDDYDMDVAWAKIQRDPYDDAGIWGEVGSGSGDNIKLCFVEWMTWSNPNDTVINSNHVAFDDWLNGPSRVLTQEVCTSSSTCTPWTNQGVWTHLSGVAAIAAGSIEQGQDPYYTNQLLRNQRSGVARETSLMTFMGESGDDAAYRRSFERCVEEGADIIVNASSMSNTACNATANPGGIRAAIHQAILADIVVVTSTGNNISGCGVLVPATYPETIGVGAIATVNHGVSYAGEPGGSGNPGTALDPGSNAGNPQVTNVYGSLVPIPGVTITAPTNYQLWAGSGTSGPSAYANGSFGLTSGATAAMGGAVALIKEWLLDAGISPNYLILNAMVGLFGDGAVSQTGKATTFVDDLYGYGRFQMLLPVSTPSQAGEMYASRLVVATGTLSAGQAAYFPLNCYYGCATAAKGIKAALYAEDPGLDSKLVPNFDLEIVDLCDGYSVIKGSNLYPYLWKRVRVTNESTIDNTCPAIRVTLDDSGYFNNIRYAVTGYIFGPDNPYWELH